MAIKIHLLNTVPTIFEPNSIYLVKGETDIDVIMYVVGETGAAIRHTVSKTEIENLVNNGGLTWVTATDVSTPATSGNVYRMVNPASSTIVLPAAPTDGIVIGVKVSNGRLDNHIDPNGKTIESTSGPLLLDKAFANVLLRFSATSDTWEFLWGVPSSSLSTFIPEGIINVPETVYNLTGTELDARNGSIQIKFLTANAMLTNVLQSGESIVLGIDDGTGFTITIPGINWTKTGGGGTAPSLHPTLMSWIVVWKVGTVLYGSYLGDA